jgi:hypothetical protein
LTSFRERLPLVAGAQPGLDMADADPVVIRQEGGGHRRGRIPLHQDPIGVQAGEDRVQVGENCSGYPGQALAGFHQVQVNVGDDPEEVQHLVEHLAVLGGHADERLDPRRPGEGMHHRRHLDRFGTGAKDGKDAQ